MSFQHVCTLAGHGLQCEKVLERASVPAIISYSHPPVKLYGQKASPSFQWVSGMRTPDPGVFPWGYEDTFPWQAHSGLWPPSPRQQRGCICSALSPSALPTLTQEPFIHSLPMAPADPGAPLAAVAAQGTRTLCWCSASEHESYFNRFIRPSSLSLAVIHRLAGRISNQF